MDSTTTINQSPNESNTNIISHHKSSSSENHRHGGHSIAPPLHSDQKTFKTIYSFPSPRSGRFHEHHHQQQQQPYFLDACYLCKKPLGYNRDIFMYRGDTPFCSEDCRGEQIEIDEDREKKRSFSASIKALRKKEEKEKSSNSSSSPNYTFCSGAVAAA